MRLAKVLDDSVEAAPDAPHFVIAHSHGGNVALNARQAMSNDAASVHIVTLATPFISIDRRQIGIIDKIFVAIISIALVVFACYAWVVSLTFGAQIALALYYTTLFASLCSLVVGAATLVAWAYQKIRMRPMWLGGFSRFQITVLRANSRALLTGSLLLSAGLFHYKFNVVATALAVFLPALLLFFMLFPVTERLLYSLADEATGTLRKVSKVEILRSRRDEASLMLLFGRITSGLARASASISIGIPVVTALLAALVLVVTIAYAISQYLQYQECTALQQTCSMYGELIVILALGAWKLWTMAFQYLSFGILICTALIVLAATCKSGFGRELVGRSLNVDVGVFDTPDGIKSYKVNWCEPAKGSVFGLRHSLYSSPDAVSKVVTYIKEALAQPLNQEVAAISTRSRPNSRRLEWSAVATSITAVLAYAIAVMLTYPPSGATTIFCAIKARLEPSGPKGGFTILVANFANDGAGASDSLAREIRRHYGFHVIQSCLQVATADAGENLALDYNADLVIWGRVSQGGEKVDLEVARRGIREVQYTSVKLTPAFISEFTANGMRQSLFGAIEESASEDSKDVPPAVAEAYADRVEALVENADWTDRSLTGLQRQVGMYVAAARLMLAAALASNDGSRVRKAIAHFERASSIIDSSEEHEHAFSRDWEGEYDYALLWDGRLNKAADSARRAAVKYEKEYKDHFQSRTLANDRLTLFAATAASAFSDLYEITRSQDDANLAIRLACESLVLLRAPQEEREAGLIGNRFQRALRGEKGNLSEQERLERVAKLRRALVRTAEQSRASKVLRRFDKDPAAIYMPGSKIEMLRDCKTF